ncbi:DUF998 domain-containing protein [Kineococcus glutinatus]|uniref:DUF998 domain-containing protein n=1 Tax=Kineococcus glutinatus TaxID=1070872 RepID=UPI0031E60502
MTRRALLVGGAVAGPLFIAVALVQGAVRPGYEPLRHPVSSLALGPGGAVQVVNFLVTGALYAGLAVGLARAPRPAGTSRARAVLIGAAGVGLIGAGAFRTDPVGGYPPGAPDALAGYSTAGALHDAFSVPVFLAVPAAALLHARARRREGDGGWAVASAGCGLVVLAGFGAASAGFGQHPALVDVAGLVQRLSLTAGFGWLSALAVQALRQPASNVPR